MAAFAFRPIAVTRADGSSVLIALSVNFSRQRGCLGTYLEHQHSISKFRKGNAG